MHHKEFFIVNCWSIFRFFNLNHRIFLNGTLLDISWVSERDFSSCRTTIMEYTSSPVCTCYMERETVSANFSVGPLSHQHKLLFYFFAQDKPLRRFAMWWSFPQYREEIGENFEIHASSEGIIENPIGWHPSTSNLSSVFWCLLQDKHLTTNNRRPCSGNQLIAIREP